MFRQLIAVSVVALCVGAGMATARAEGPAKADTYKWNAELVSVDEGTKTVTVKAHAITQAAKDVAQFNPGDRLLLTWSGFDSYADAIRQVAKHNAAHTFSSAWRPGQRAAGQ